MAAETCSNITIIYKP